MTKSYKAITQNASQQVAKFHKEFPNVMSAFSALGKSSVGEEGVLGKKTKELIALAIGVAGHCDGCIGFHTQALVKLGATREEVMEALTVAIYMGGGPSLMFAAEALQAFEEFSGA